MSALSVQQKLKMVILAEGLSLTDCARNKLEEATGNNNISTADYASTSGIILAFDDTVWVNAPIKDYNPNFVDNPTAVLDTDGNGFFVTYKDFISRAYYCLQASCNNGDKKSYPEQLVVTHGDRARLSPLSGCSMSCQFCDIPFTVKKSDYQLYPIKTCIDALSAAVLDPVQPARHILVSGGTPKSSDVEHYRTLYRRILQTFTDIDVDIMMVPIPGILNLDELKNEGINELSVNLEIYDEERAKMLAPQKYSYGLKYYLDFIEKAVDILGFAKVRSVLLVGLESIESTLEGVRALAKRGATPVLSPFRPDPATPLRTMRPPSFIEMQEVYLRAQDILLEYGLSLGPSCPPCTHNTLSFATSVSGEAIYKYASPNLLL